MKNKSTFFQNYRSSIILLLSILAGAFLGTILKEKAVLVKPLGDIFLNLLFTIVVPLVFFSIASAVAGMGDASRLGKIIGWMLVFFLATSLIASFIMIVGVKMYPPALGVKLTLAAPTEMEKLNVGQQIVKAFTVSDFSELLSKKNMLALIVFSILIGLGAGRAGEKAKAFVQFLAAGKEVMMKVIGYIMLYAPIGLGAYFAYIVGTFGSQLMGAYMRVVVLYYPLALAYFFIAFSGYAYLAGGRPGVKIFWANIVPTSLTAWATGSSLATIPMNLQAAERMGVPKDIREVVIPIGISTHKDGSCLAAILKIAFLFGLFNMPFEGVWTIATAVGIAILSGTVMGGIPGGGFLGELLIVTLYGFPVEALPIISMIGTLVDPPATMVNAVCDNVASMVIARIFGGKNWMKISGPGLA